MRSRPEFIFIILIIFIIIFIFLFKLHLDRFEGRVGARPQLPAASSSLQPLATGDSFERNERSEPSPLPLASRPSVARSSQRTSGSISGAFWLGRSSSSKMNEIEDLIGNRTYSRIMGFKSLLVYKRRDLRKSKVPRRHGEIGRWRSLRASCKWRPWDASPTVLQLILRPSFQLSYKFTARSFEISEPQPGRSQDMRTWLILTHFTYYLCWAELFRLLNEVKYS